MENTEFVNVAVRVRPHSTDDTNTCNLKVIPNNPPILTISNRHNYTFDYIFDGNANQATVFNEIISPMIDKFLKGYNCTVFAYGQTGAGKTYTMGYPQVNEDDMGIVNRTFKEIFNKVNEFDIFTEVSLYEIYNEKAFDLLTEDKVPLPVRGFVVPDLRKVPVCDLSEAQELFLTASKNRRTGGTLQNSKSSRSHAIYTLYCTISNGETKKTLKFNFVDLAGSESVRKTGSVGNTFHEGININKGLLCLGQVINALSTNQKYIPYRQSIITTILKDSLSTNNFITLIACVSSKSTDSTETLQTLDFANRVKRISNKPNAVAMVDNSFRDSSMVPSKYITPIKSLRPVQTSTALRTSARPSFAKFPFQVAEEPCVSISPIVRRCFEEIESKFTSTIGDLVQKETRKLFRRSTRIANLCKKFEEEDENKNNLSNLSNSFKKFKPNDSQSETLKDITNIKINSIEENKTIVDDHNDNKERKDSIIFKVPSLINTSNITIKSVNRLNLSNSVKKSTNLRRSTRIRKAPVQLINEMLENSNLFNRTKVVNKSKRNVKSKDESKVVTSEEKNHCERVLEILNEGSLKDLKSLQTIGTKSAEQILLFRELRGKFKAIEDTKNVFIRGKAYERFMEANFLT